jgi:biotin carboxyl carrier protein
MPGDIVEVKVKEGEDVEVGQELCVLEAMKMRNMIRSPQAGTVTLIEVSVGDSVQYGAPLMWVE